MKLGFDQAAALRTATVYALRLGLFANDEEVEDLIIAGVVSLNEDFGFPANTHDGWVIGERPIPTPPGETAVRFVTAPQGHGGGF